MSVHIQVILFKMCPVQHHTMMPVGIFLLLLVSAESFPAHEEDSSTCPEHWVDATSTGLGCLLFNSSQAYTWEEANNYCQRDENASLVEILTIRQLDFIRLELFHDGWRYGDWWTSGTDLAREGEWYWGPSRLSVADWVWSWSLGTNEHEPSGGTSRNCMIMSTEFYACTAYACTAGNYPICQKK